MTNLLNVIHQLDTIPPISRTKKAKSKSRRERRQELRDRLKAAKNNQK